jgi:tetratricopeptide (TPR) repeat protein
MTAAKTFPSVPPRALFIGLLLIAATFTLYVPSAGFEFINCDDPDYITDNPDVLGGLTWQGVMWAFAAPHAGNWIPLAWLSHMLDVSLFGLDAGWPHLENALIHAVNAALVFWLFLRWTGGLWRSAFVAALFAWHPLRVESVAWVCERRDVLCAFFMLLALLAYTRCVLESKVHSPKCRRFYWLTLGLFVLALMSKPMAVTLPLMLLLVDFWPFGRFQGLGFRVQGRGRLLAEKIPFFALSGIFSVATVLGQNAAGAVFSVQSLPVLLRLQNAGVSYARYVGKIFWPANLGMPYPLEYWPVSLRVISFALIAGLSVWAIRQASRRPYIFMGWFWFLATLLPVIGLIQAGSQAIADRFVYLPCLGLFLIIVQGAEEVWPQSVPGKWLKGAAAAVILSVCAWRSGVQLSYWQNSGTMFGHTLAVTGANPFASQDYGCYLRDHGHLDAAIAQFRAALQVSPKDGNLLTDLAYAVGIKKRQYAQAVPMYEAALRVKPDEWDIHYDFATILGQLGRTDEMIRQYQEVLRLKPDDAAAHDRLGIALAGKGELDEAIGHFQEALRLEPDSIGAHCNLGNALTVKKQYPEAIQQYQAALRLDPHYAFAQNNLGSALEFSGRLAEAGEHYRAAIKLQPDYATAHFNLGCLLARTGQRQEAVAQLKETLRLQPDYPEAARKLAGLGEQP